MKKKLIAGMLITSMLTLLSGCKGNTDTANNLTPTGSSDISTAASVTEVRENINLSSIKYSTVTEVFDWGPSVTKVILDLGITLDSSTFLPDSFAATFTKGYTLPGATKPKVENQKVEIASVYVSDANGNNIEDGTYLTIETKIEPNSYLLMYSGGSTSGIADISFSIKLTNGVALKATDGSNVTMATIDRHGFTGNRILIAEDFDTSGSFTKDDITLHYASYIPKTASTAEGSNPLIIWLHGGGEGGTDPTVAIAGNKMVNLATEEIQSFFGTTGAYILAPQSPTMWMDNGTGTFLTPDVDSEGNSVYTKSLMGLIDEYVTNHPEIDKKRIYIGGCSNGGYMTMNMIITYPDYFTAAYPTCEAYYVNWLTDEKIQKIVNIPIWFIQAKNDPVVKVYDGNTRLDNFSNAAYDRLVKAGAENIHYSLFDKVEDLSGKYFQSDNTTPYEYIGHYTWIYTFNNQCTDTINGKEVTLFEWLSEQSK